LFGSKRSLKSAGGKSIWPTFSPLRQQMASTCTFAADNGTPATMARVELKIQVDTGRVTASHDVTAQRRPQQLSIPVRSRRNQMDRITTYRSLVAYLCGTEVDAVIRVTNENLLEEVGYYESRGIDERAGPDLRRACQALGCRAIGEACITEGYGFSAKHIIHVIGPPHHLGEGVAGPLRSCYRAALRLAQEHQLGRLAFPGRILDESCRRDDAKACGRAIEINYDVAIETMQEWLRVNEFPQRVKIYCDGGEGHGILRRYMSLLPPASQDEPGAATDGGSSRLVIGAQSGPRSASESDPPGFRGSSSEAGCRCPLLSVALVPSGADRYCPAAG
jgi:hypothetical protein